MEPIDDQRRPQGGIAGVLGVLGRRWALIGGWTFVCTALAVWGIVSLAPRYRAEAVLLLSTRTEHLSDLKSVVSGPLPSIPDPNVARGEVEVLKGRLLAREVIEELGLQNSRDLSPHVSMTSRALATLRPWLGLPAVAAPVRSAEQRMADAVDAYLKRFGAFNDGRSFSLSLSYESSDPETAARVVNAHAERYMADQRDLKRRADQRATQWLTAEVTRLHADLEKKQAAIRDRQEQAGLVGSTGATALERQVADLGSSLAAARADLALRDSRLASARQDGNASQAIIDSDLIHRLREQEARAQQRTAGLAQQHGGAYPELADARAQAADISAKIAQETARILQGLQTDQVTARQRVTDLTATIAKLQEQRDQQAAAATDVDSLQRDAQATRSVYQTLLGRLGEIEAQTGAEDADARLISPAAPPDLPFFPNVPLFASVALMLSAASGTLLAWLLEQRHRGITQPDELHALGLTALEAIPAVSGRALRGGPLVDIVLTDPKSAIAEQLRALRGDIALPRTGDVPRIVALTSALPGEGKTTTAVLLGRSMAAAGLHVLLVECDMRRPTAMRQLGLKHSRPGLVAVLRDGLPLGAAGCDDRKSTMRVLAPEERVTRPQDLLGAAALGRLFAEARKQYDYVLIDTPPLGAVSDAMLVVPLVDWTLLVVRWKVTPVAAVAAVMRKLARRNLRVAGAVLTATDMKRATPKNLAGLYRAGRDYAQRSQTWPVE